MVTNKLHSILKTIFSQRKKKSGNNEEPACMLPFLVGLLRESSSPSFQKISMDYNPNIKDMITKLLCA